MPKAPGKFRARKDAWGAVFVAVILCIGGFLLARGDLIPWPMADKFGWLFILFGVLAAWDWWVTSYEINQEDLVIRSGLSRSRIALCNIEELCSRGNALRIKCQRLHGSKWVRLLPKENDRSAFLVRLRGKCPWL